MKEKLKCGQFVHSKYIYLFDVRSYVAMFHIFRSDLENYRPIPISRNNFNSKGILNYRYQDGRFTKTFVGLMK